jgi:hypothetical protein
VQALIRSALELTKLNLTYTYGSADPASGGMDCSGAIYYLLRSAGFPEVPRDSAGQYVWTRRAGTFRSVVGQSEKSFEFAELRPGDLLFWSGTYSVEREFPITHVMLYLGTERRTNRRVMTGASDGRTYDGVSRWGVSVFDFRMPRKDPANPEKSRATFVGYGAIPGLIHGDAVAQTAAPGNDEKPESARGTEDPESPAEKSTPKAKQSSGAAKKAAPTPRRTSTKATPKKRSSN